MTDDGRSIPIYGYAQVARGFYVNFLTRAGGALDVYSAHQRRGTTDLPGSHPARTEVNA